MLARHIICLFFIADTAIADDWPQLGHDPARTSRSADPVAPPFRAKWIWVGTDKTLRRQTDRLSGNEDYPFPEKVTFAFAARVQPIVVDKTAYAPDLDGHLYAISIADGHTLWTADNPGGSCTSAACADNTVVVTSIPGAVAAFDAKTGQRKWRRETPKAITASPLILGSVVYVPCHDGNLYAFDLTTGVPRWKSKLSAPLVADACADDSAIYLGAEDMNFFKIEVATGHILAQTRLNGQSFRLLHPVLHADRHLLLVQTVQPICVGSEYVMEAVMRDSPDLAAEQENILRWLKGDTNNGAWKDASPAWKHLYALRTGDLSEPFTIPNGPADGCGQPAPPPCIDAKGRAFSWFKTRYPTLTAVGSFGTKYSMDISAIDLQTGRRQPIDNGRLSGTSGESDNLFNLSVAGHYLYLRQDFRGTKMIDLDKSTSRLIQAPIRHHDGGTWNADVVYRNQAGLPRTSQPPLRGRAAPVLADGHILFCEPYAVVCIEHAGE
jgi:hypothetical protein